MEITIHCGKCEGTFAIEHPSISHAADLKITILTCSWCGASLRMPSNELHMVAVDNVPDNVVQMVRA